MTKWTKVIGGFTPGGEAAYGCPNCGTVHLRGPENPEALTHCPDCGAGSFDY